MTSARQCDICRDFFVVPYEPPEKRDDFNKITLSFRTNEALKMYNNACLDVCPSCAKSFCQWVDSRSDHD